MPSIPRALLLGVLLASTSAMIQAADPLLFAVTVHRRGAVCSVYARHRGCAV